MPAKLMLGLTAALAAALLAWWWWPAGQPPARMPEASNLLPIAEAMPSAAPAESEPVSRQQMTAADTLALRVFGRVLDRDGEPIAAATLRLKARDAAGPNDPVLAEGISTDDGSFAITCAAQWHQPFRIFVAAPGCSSLSQDPIVPGHELTFHLNRLTWLFGRVVAKGTQVPVVGGLVSASGLEARTDAFGNYELLGAAIGGDTWIVVRGDGFVEESTTLRVSEPGRTEANFALQPVVALALRIVDRDTAFPIAGAELRRSTFGPVLTTSDLDGRCSLPVGEGRDLTVEVSAADHCPLRWSWQVTEAADNLVTLPLLGSATLAGRAVDDHGAPLAKVQVDSAIEGDGFALRRLSPAQLQAHKLPGSATDENPGHGILTDEQGHFTILVRPSVSPIRALGLIEGCVLAKSQQVVLAAPGSSAIVELTMVRGGIVHGTVRRNGKPFQGNLRSRAVGETAWAHFTFIESDGTYETDRLPPGPHEIGVFPEGAKEPLRQASVQVVAGQRIQHDFAWEVATCKISGRVATSSGKPLAGVIVRAETKGVFTVQDSSRTEADGRYALEADVGKLYTIRVNRGVTTAKRDEVLACARDVDFVLTDLGHVRLRLLDAVSREPVRSSGPGLWNLAWRSSDAEAFTELRRNPDAAGVVDLELPLGAVDVVVSMLAAGYAPQRALSLPVVDQSAPTPIDVLLERGVDVRVELVGPSSAGDAMEGHLLFLLHSSQLDLLRGPFADQGGPSNMRINGINLWMGEPGLMQQLLSLDSDGGALLKGLVPGNYRLVAFPDEFVFSPPTVTIGEGGGTARLQWRRR